MLRYSTGSAKNCLDQWITYTHSIVHGKRLESHINTWLNKINLKYHERRNQRLVKVTTAYFYVPQPGNNTRQCGRSFQCHIRLCICLVTGEFADVIFIRDGDQIRRATCCWLDLSLFIFFLSILNQNKHHGAKGKKEHGTGFFFLIQNLR